LIKSPGALLTDAQRETLRAAAARILPSEDGPGAAEAGVAAYVAAALGEERLNGWLSFFVHGLGRIEAISRETLGKGFPEAAPEEQDEILRQLQAMPEPHLRHFFGQLVRLCIEGFLGDPRYGGNRDGLGWRYVGYPHDEMEEDGCLRVIPG
jgi:gluconate 2-dehydrogenase gamma chain